MGMSASQVRLLTITARIHDLENEAQRIQNQKLLLANESDEAYQEYLASLEQKNIQTLVFNSDTGKYNWNEVGVQGLCDNGYALKVRNLVTGDMYRYTSSGNIWNGITTSSTLQDAYEVSPPGGFIQDIVQEDTSTYTTVIDIAQLQQAIIDGDTNFVINDVNGLNALADYVNANNNNNCLGLNFVLGGDIDATGFNQSIGVSHNAQKFVGTLNGNGYEVYNLDKSLFNCVSSTITGGAELYACVKNLGITNSNITATGDCGFLAKNGAGHIVNCYVKNSTLNSTSSGNCGGLIGKQASYTAIYSSYVSSDVTINGSNNTNIGGFVGYRNGNTLNIYNSFVSNDTSGGQYVGAYIGYDYGNNNYNFVRVNNSYTTNNENYIGYKAFPNNGLIIEGDCRNPSGSIQQINNLTVTDGDNNTGLYDFTFNVTVDNIDYPITINGNANMTVAQWLTALKTELNTTFNTQSFNATIENNHLCISTWEAHTINNVSIDAGFITNFNNRFGLGNGGTNSVSTELIGDEWVYCHSMQDVRDALGCPSTVADSPAFLRELLSNAMAIVCTYEDVEEEGETVRHYTETSVSVDTHIKEEQNNSEMAKAEADYESALRKIDQKDKKYDKELAAIENQRTAVKEEFDTLKTCIKDNIDRTFKIFS